MTRLANFLNHSSKFATAEQKRITMEAIVASGTVGIKSSDLRKVNGLSQHDQMLLMRHLSDYGAIRKVSIEYVGKTPYHRWSAIW